jgi:hypothetical protein
MIAAYWALSEFYVVWQSNPTGKLKDKLIAVS